MVLCNFIGLFNIETNPDLIPLKPGISDSVA